MGRHRATPHRPHCRTASLLERHRADDKPTHTVSQLRRSTLHRKPSGKKKKKQNQERLYHKMMTIKRGFWCLCVSALLAGAVCQESRRNLMDMHEAVDAATDAMNATDDMMNGTMMNDTMMNDTMMNGTMEGEGEEAAEDAADDGGRRKLLDMHEAAMDAMDNATDAVMNATMNATDAMMNGTMNGTMMNDTEEHDHDHDHEGDDHSDDDGEASEDDSRRMLRKLAMA